MRTIPVLCAVLRQNHLGSTVPPHHIKLLYASGPSCSTTPRVVFRSIGHIHGLRVALAAEYSQCIHHNLDLEASQHGAHGVVVSHPLRMRKALGSIPSVSIYSAGCARRTLMGALGTEVDLGRTERCSPFAHRLAHLLPHPLSNCTANLEFRLPAIRTRRKADKQTRPFILTMPLYPATN